MATDAGDHYQEDTREYARLRSLTSRQPGGVQLLHSNQGRDAWLADANVLVKVTGSPAVEGLDDGLYRLMNKGLVPMAGRVTINLPIYFSQVRGCTRLPVYPTIWSLTENEAKAMLFYVEVPEAESQARMRIPLAMNEDIWRAYVKCYPDLTAWHSGHKSPFLISTPDEPELAYIAPITIPGHAQENAYEFVRTYRQPDGAVHGDSPDPV
jgi:hypothetical protein